MYSNKDPIDNDITYGLSNINNQCNLFIDLEIDDEDFKFTINAKDTSFKLVNDSLTITITKNLPLNFNVSAFTNQSMVTENIANMSNSIITIDFFAKYVSNIDKGNILIIEPMHPYNSNINGRLAYYPYYYPTHNEGKPYKIIDSNVYFLPEYRGIEYSNIFKLYASNIETNSSYSTYYLQVNCICSENRIPAIKLKPEYNNILYYTYCNLLNHTCNIENISDNVAIFPLAIPLLSGPAAITSVIVIVSEFGDNFVHQLIGVSSLLSVMLITLILFTIVSKSQQFINKKVINVFSRVISIILAGLSIQYIVDGVLSLV